MLPQQNGPGLTVGEGISLIRAKAAANSLVFAKAARANIENYDCDVYEVAEMLAHVSQWDMLEQPSPAKQFPNCVMYTFRLHGYPSTLDVGEWYSHVAVNHVTKDVVVLASWKPF